MEKYTQKELRHFAEIGAAVDLTSASYEDVPEHYEKIGYSMGVNGMNGGIFRDLQSGQLYVITARNSLLARVF